MARSFADKSMGDETRGEEKTGPGMFGSRSVGGGVIFRMWFEYTGGERFVVGKVKDGCLSDIIVGWGLLLGWFDGWRWLTSSS